MNIAIIGTGNVGSALGASLSKAGHNVTFAGRVANKADAIRDAEVIILAVPYGAVAQVSAEIAPFVDSKVVIDTTNPLKSDLSGLATDGGPSAAELIATALPGAHVVKAFNTVFAGIQADPGSSSEPVDALFATDNEEARATVTQLAESIGFRPVYVGPLAAARELEAVAFMNIRLQVITGGSWNTAVKLVDPPAKAMAA